MVGRGLGLLGLAVVVSSLDLLTGRHLGPLSVPQPPHQHQAEIPLTSHGLG